MADIPKAVLEAFCRLIEELSSTVGSISSNGDLSLGAMSMSGSPGENPRVCKGRFGSYVSDVRGGEI